MKLLRWKRFTWPLAKLPPVETQLPAPFSVRHAQADEAKTVTQAVMTAFSLDSSWSDTLTQFRERLELQLDLSFHRESLPALVITHGTRIIAASVLNTEIDADSHLVSGPAVLTEYCNRGLGSALLHATLMQLREAGLERVSAITKDNSTACKFVYPKFGSTCLDYDYSPALAET